MKVGEFSVKWMLKKCLMSCVLVAFLAQPVLGQGMPRGPAQQGAPGQPRQKVVMESVFFNVVWGSAMGATLGIASAVLGSKDPSQPNQVRQNAFSGATAGGIIGVGLGLFFVYTGITFDNSASPLFPVTMRGESREMLAGHSESGSPMLAMKDISPFSVETAPKGPFRITGFKARLFSMRF